ncbi:MAG: malate dehydrogenase, partial [Planctomycetota bacterium]
DKGLSQDYIIPSMDEWEVFPREAAAVGAKAIEQAIAQQPMTREELYKTAESIIKKARDETQMLMQAGFIPDPDKES